MIGLKNLLKDNDFLGSKGLPVLGTALLLSISACQSTQSNQYTAPKTAFGQPDIGGLWTNVTITKLTRPRELGDRLIYSEEEVAQIENQADIEAAEGVKPVDPDAPAEFRHDSDVELRPEFAAAGGATGFYDHFWLDPGSRVMRVDGEPRTSILTTENGQVPAAKPSASSSGRSMGRAYDSYESRPLGDSDISPKAANIRLAKCSLWRSVLIRLCGLASGNRK